MRISDWSSDVCSSDLKAFPRGVHGGIDIRCRGLLHGADRLAGRRVHRLEGLAAAGIRVAAMNVELLLGQVTGHVWGLVLLQQAAGVVACDDARLVEDRKSTRLNSSH